MKKAIILSVIFLAVSSFIIFKTKILSLAPDESTATSQTAEVETESDQFETFSKLATGEIKQAKTAAEDLVKAKLSNDIQKSTKNTFKKDNRILLGEKAKDYHQKPWKLVYLNQPNPDWKRLLGNELTRQFPENSKVHIKKLASYISLRGEKAQYIEEVIISSDLPQNQGGSFKAMVDSETGKILYTWDGAMKTPLDSKDMKKFKADGQI